MDKRIKSRTLEDWWATLNSWDVPPLFLFKCRRANRKLARYEDGRIRNSPYFEGLFDMLSALLTNKEQMAGWNRRFPIDP